MAEQVTLRKLDPRNETGSEGKEMSNVTVIRATRPRGSITMEGPVSRNLRVAAYARVSTDQEEQETSFEAQCNFYTQKIQSNPHWTFVKMYADDGTTGTNTLRREGFNQMVEDALDGKIDLILTKSVSRFARNTVDALQTCRALKARGVDIYFEKENIHLIDGQGEVMLTIMAALAQDESRSISENVTWGIRYKFKNGKFSLPYKHFLGYRKGADGFPEIVEEEAVIIRRIYKLYLEGTSPSGIAAILNDEEIPSPSGKSKWTYSNVKSILTNEKYCGDARLQKTYVVDFLNHKKAVNMGEVDQYYHHNSHEGIVSHEVFEYVQGEIERRKTLPTTCGKSVFSGRLFCKECGGMYGSKVHHSTDKYRKVIFRCNDKYKKDEPCHTLTLTEEQIENAFMSAVRTITTDSEILTACDDIITYFANTKNEQSALDDAKLDASILETKINKLIDNASQGGISNAEYQAQYSLMVGKYDKLAEKIARLTEQINTKNRKCNEIRYFRSMLEKAEKAEFGFGKELWVGLVEKALVGEKDITFVFRNGTETTIEL